MLAERSLSSACLLRRACLIFVVVFLSLVGAGARAIQEDSRTVVV